MVIEKRVTAGPADNIRLPCLESPKSQSSNNIKKHLKEAGAVLRGHVDESLQGIVDKMTNTIKT